MFDAWSCMLQSVRRPVHKTISPIVTHLVCVQDHPTLISQNMGLLVVSFTLFPQLLAAFMQDTHEGWSHKAQLNI